MRHRITCPLVCGLIVLLAGAGLAQAQEIDWQKMDGDVLVMAKLVSHALQRVLAGPQAVYEPPTIYPNASQQAAQPGDLAVPSPPELPEAKAEEPEAPVQKQANDARARLRVPSEAARVRGEQASILAQRLEAKARSLGWWPLRKGVDAIYLPGYGALFVAEVGFPLAPGELPAEEAPPKETGDWHKAREGLYGILVLPTFEIKPYNEEIVQGVKEALTELLATEAKHFTELPQDERVTVFLYGRVSEKERVTQRVTSALSEQGAAGASAMKMARLKASVSGAPRRTVLAVSVKASVLSAQREGKLTPEEVKARVEIAHR